ncbi:SHOCT domain-containing protein [Virgibacillus soli]|uniref:SHOCT domain-containing protein n=1 Tax=Paracerasibacillus soli TaxID=480284 RepID=A0ABU5CVU8_9BACI|nr:SHOCT domain-containing protein [Virgibacillus soli]MDY0410375.1 SHOCT domain-containing protein [Virgibacillus soli]
MLMSLYSLPVTVRIILSIIVLIVLTIILVRFNAKKNPKRDSLEILKERFEKGEVSFADYLHAKRSRGK